jgi:hypothetical protein
LKTGFPTGLQPGYAKPGLPLKNNSFQPGNRVSLLKVERELKEEGEGENKRGFREKPGTRFRSPALFSGETGFCAKRLEPGSNTRSSPTQNNKPKLKGQHKTMNPTHIELPALAESDHPLHAKWLLHCEARVIEELLDDKISTYSEWQQRAWEKLSMNRHAFHQAFCYLTERVPRFTVRALKEMHFSAREIRAIKDRTGSIDCQWSQRPKE